MSVRAHPQRPRAAPHLLCIAGVDHHLRIPFLLALREHGFRVSAAGTGDPARFAEAGLEFHGYDFARFVGPAADLAAVARLGRLIAEVRPDLVHSFDTKPNLLVPLALRRCPKLPLVRTINGLGWLYSSRSPAASALRPIYLALQRLAAGRTSATVFQNREDAAFFARLRLMGNSQGCLIPGSGVDDRKFARDQAAGPPPERLRAELGLDAAEVVMTVTRLTRQKGISTLLAAAALVHAVRPAVRFVLVGPRQSEGPLAVAQAEIDRHAPYVVATGPRTDVPALLGLADVFAFPTEYREGVPRALLEAALAGVPVVATRMPGCVDVIRDGWSGHLVPCRSPPALAGRILDLLADRPRALEMAARAARLVRRDFGLDTVVAHHMALYAEVLGRANATAPQTPAPIRPALPSPGVS